MQKITRSIWPTLFLLLGLQAAAQSSTRVRVVDQTGAGIANILLISHQPDRIERNIVLTDKTGHATVSGLSCSLCAITAIDPQSLFFSKTTEFQNKACCVRIGMRVRPIIDRAFLPGTVKASFVIDAPNGAPLANTKVVVRSEKMGIESGSFYIDTTTPNGSLTLDELPGKYVVAAVIYGKTCEADVSITRKPHKHPTVVRLAPSNSGETSKTAFARSDPTE